MTLLSEIMPLLWVASILLIPFVGARRSWSSLRIGLVTGGIASLFMAIPYALDISISSRGEFDLGVFALYMGLGWLVGTIAQGLVVAGVVSGIRRVMKRWHSR